MRRCRALAAEAAASGGQKDLGDPGAPTLTVSPGRWLAGAELSGPLVEADQGTRILGKLAKKAAQTRAARSIWIWIEDHGALHPLTPFRVESLEHKVRSMRDLVTSELAESSHIAGVVFSSVARNWETTEDEMVEAPGGVALVRGVDANRVRESIVIPQQLSSVEGTMVVRLCADESSWLDWALKRLGIEGGALSLLSHQELRLP